MAQGRVFRIVSASGSKRKGLQLLDPVFEEPVYTIDTNDSSDAVLVQRAKDGKSIGTVTVTTPTGNASFAVTGFKDVSSAVIRMTDLSVTRGKNRFSFDIKTPTFLEQRLQWKYSDDAPFWTGKSDPGSMKLVYTGTTNVIARFTHNGGAPNLMEGALELLESHGPAWDFTVFMSCLAVLKYGTLMLRRKSSPSMSSWTVKRP